MSFDVAVIGRGMIGSAAARHLAEAGDSVALVGPDQPEDRTASEGPFASHHDVGRITRIAGRDALWTEIAARSLERYADIEARSGITFHTPCGMVAVYGDADDWVARAGPWGSGARRVDAGWVRRETGIAYDGDMPMLFEPAPAGHIDPLAMVEAQTRLAEQAGATVVRDAVTSVSRAAGGVEVVGRWGSIRADRVLAATGAFGSELFEFELVAERRPRTILRAELADDGRVPSLICMDPPDQRVEEIYWVPPVRYPDGTVCIKIGGNLRGFVPLAADDLTEWFHGDGDPVEIESLEANLRSLLPDAELGPMTTAPCVITGTESRHPYIGWADDGIAVAIAGNGSAAKSSDELGRLAAGLFGDDGWVPDSGIDPAAFTPVMA